MILKVAKLGVKALRAVSQPVDPRAVARGDYEPFLTDLEETMREYDGTGIADGVGEGAAGQEWQPRQEAVVLPEQVAAAPSRPWREGVLLRQVRQVQVLQAPPPTRLPPSAPRPPAHPFPR